MNNKKIVQTKLIGVHKKCFYCGNTAEIRLSETVHYQNNNKHKVELYFCKKCKYLVALISYIKDMDNITMYEAYQKALTYINKNKVK